MLTHSCPLSQAAYRSCSIGAESPLTDCKQPEDDEQTEAISVFTLLQREQQTLAHCHQPALSQTEFIL
eukprot:m.284892 g.284892  ORF g.284892 m.284892 type:complete len:68 (+) comp54964_c1_seq123:1060-1263(+)